MEKNINTIVSEILAWYSTEGGGSYIGEKVTQFEHAAQCADRAAAAGADSEVICAAFLHDIGHLCAGDISEHMGEFGVSRHEQVGAEYLRALGFSERVVALVGGHVDAKRYLTFRDPAYAARLSPASVATLAYQGGPMDAAQATAFELAPEFKQILRLRAWDEAAKVEQAAVAPLDHYGRLLEDHLRNQRRALRSRGKLNAAQLAFWHAHGYLKIEGFLSALEQAELSDWVDDLQARPESPGLWMKYFESPAGGKDTRQLCRVENFLEYHDELAELINGVNTLALISELFGEPACLFKEKINYKLPGGDGFAPHQDAPAFTSFDQTIHITLMLSIDATHPANGCLEVAPHPGKQALMPAAPDLTIDATLADTLVWTPIPTDPGDLLVFDSYLPHRSAPNRTDRPRRALYVTYNKAAEGDFRDAYYALKRAVFPPDIEREPGRDYGSAGVFNVGNPIR